MMKTVFLACAVILLLTSGACGKADQPANSDAATPPHGKNGTTPHDQLPESRQGLSITVDHSRTLVYRVKSPMGRIGIRRSPHHCKAVWWRSGPTWAIV